MDFINIIFRCIDFFIIVGILIFGVKKYFIPSMEKLIREYGVFMYNLESDCKNLQLQSQSISENIQDQEHQFSLLQKNFITWQKQCKDQVVARKLSQEKIDHKMELRYLQRSVLLQQEKVLQDQLPKIIDDATKTLQQKYYGTQDQKDYMHELIENMKGKL